MFTFPMPHSASRPQVFDGTVMVSGSNGSMSLSTNGGATWSNKPVNTGFDGGLWGIYLSGTTIVAYGNNGFVEKSTDGGVSWAACPIQYDARVTSVVYDSTNSVWVASVSDRIYTSTDLVTWTYRTTPSPFSQIKSLAFGAGVLVLIGTNSIVYTSSNGGVSWTARSFASIPSGTSMNAVSFSSSLFMAVGSGGEVQKSADGISWTRLTSGTVENLNAVTKHGSIWVAVGDSKTIITSSDATAWTARSAGAGQLGAASYCSVKSSGSSLIICASNDNDYQVSSDGITWTKYDISIAGYSLSSGEMPIFCDSLYLSSASKWLIVGEFRNSNSGFSSTKWKTLCVSSPSLSSGWSQVSISGNSVRTYRSMQYDAFTDTWYGVAEGTTYLIKSTDGGDSWSTLDVRSSVLFDGTKPIGALYNDSAGVFIMTLAGTGEVYRSVDGCSSWSLVATISSLGGTGTFHPYKAGGYINGRFIIPCSGGAIMHSVTGRKWKCTQASSVDICQVAFGGGIWVAVGYNGTIITSSNLSSWVTRINATSTISAIAQVYYDGGWFYAYTASGQVHRSQNGVVWSISSYTSPADLFSIGNEYSYSRSNNGGRRGFLASNYGVFRSGDNFTFTAVSQIASSGGWKSTSIVDSSNDYLLKGPYLVRRNRDTNEVVHLSRINKDTLVESNLYRIAK